MEKISHNAPETRRNENGPRCKSCRLGCLRCLWTNYFEFSITAIAKFAPAIPTYGGSSFHDEVGTCYCRQIRYLIVNDAFKWAILRVRYSRTDINTGTSHLMSMSSSFKLYRMFLLTKCFVICDLLPQKQAELAHSGFALAAKTFSWGSLRQTCDFSGTGLYDI